MQHPERHDFKCAFVRGGEQADIDVDADAEPGRAPDVDVHGPDVDVTTEEKTVDVPDVDVDVKTEEKTIDVPKVDVDVPEENENE